jgi:hypothetical protein
VFHTIKSTGRRVYAAFGPVDIDDRPWRGNVVRYEQCPVCVVKDLTHRSPCVPGGNDISNCRAEQAGRSGPSKPIRQPHSLQRLSA